MFLFGVLIVSLVSRCVLSISNKNITEDLSEALFDLSSIAVQGRQAQPGYPQYYPQQRPSYLNYYNPEKYQYGYPPPDYNTNEIPDSPYPYYQPSSYNRYPYNRKPPFLEKTQQSVMDALFSIAQNDNLQCVPKLLCEVTSGGLTGRQGGLNLPNINFESLAAVLSGLNSANMSPVLHFGKAAILGFASKGNTRSCHYAYPQCPNDPDRLIQYLNNHNGGFFRFFQGLNPSSTYPNYYQQQQNYAQYYNGYRPGYLGKSALAEKRIQIRPSDFASGNNNNYFDSEVYFKEHRGLRFPSHKAEFPSYYNEDHSNGKTLRFPSEEYNNNDPYRRGKKLQFESYHTNDNNYLDIQRPLPNHIPTPNIFPDRTGTGQLKLDSDDFEANHQQSLAYDFDEYNRLLYDSFPSDGNRRPSRLSFPNK